MAYVTSFSGSSEITSFDYEVAVLSWDEDFQDLTFASLPEVSEEDTFNNVPIGILASVGPVATVGGAAIGTGPNIFRFDGVEWTYHTLGITYSGFNDPSTQYYWYGYSDTSIIKTENTISGIVSELSCFDPSNPEAGWSTLTLQDSDSDSGRYTEGFPTLTNEVASQDSTVYPRSVWPQWTQVPVSMQADLQAAGIDTTTMVNQSPHFLAFMTRDDGGDPQETKVVFFRNGGLMRDDQGQVLVETFTGQQMFQILDPTHRYQTALSGKLPAIPDGFVTFPAGSDLDATDQITLHHYANYSVRDPIQAWVVQSITIDSGYQSLERCYAYADLSAATDGTGTVLQFEKVTEYSACSEPSDQAYGYTVSYFYNGLPPTSTGVQEASEGEDHDVLEQSYSLLSGLSRSKEVYDHGDDLQSQTVNTWAVSTQVATSPDGSSSRDLYVGMPQITSILESQQGIGRSMDFTYDPASGSPSSVISSYYDSTGRLLLQRRTSEFAFQIYPDLWTRNILAPVAQAVLESQYDGDAQWQRIALTVHTFEAWTRADGSIYWAEKDTWIPKQADSPDFAWWTGETPPSTWQAKSRILERNDQGAVALRLDPLGRPTLTLYDDAARFPIATFGNTDAGACYDSFETYQAATWSASPGSSAAVIDDDAFTGEQCVQISASSTFERRLTLPRDMDGSSWVFGLWLKVPSEGAIPRVTLEFSYQGATLSKVLSPTPGQWKAAQWIADLSALNVAAGAELTLSIVSEIDAGQWVRLDDLWVTPLTAQFGATAYDSERMTQSASLAANGVCSRRLYNSFLEANVAITAGTGEVATGCVKSITAPFFTRQLTPMTDGEPFPTDTPNLVITAMGRDPGILDQFKAGALSDYSALEGSVDSWTCSERRLTHTGSSDSPLGDRLRRDDFSAESLAISVQVNGEDTSAPDGVVSVGCGRYAVSWTGSEWQLLDDSGTTPVILARSTLTAWQKEWLLMVFETRILFFANGALLFSYDDEAVEGSDHGVVLGLGGDGYFQNLAVTENLGLKLAYSDGLSRTLQTLTMESGRATLLASGLFDDRGNAAISIRPSRLTTDTTADPFLYQPDYVTNADFSSDLWDGGPMTGQVVDLYHPDDGGYPFARTAFEASPLNRSVAAGKPGYDFAIRPGNQRVVATSFGSNEDSGPFLYALPVGEYHQVVDTDADGTVTVTTLDTAGNAIGTVVSSEGESAPWINSRVFDVLGRPIASLAPATYAEGITQGGEIPASATTATFNFWGQRISTTTPDTGTDRCVYTAVSQPRFLQDADGAAQGYFLYRKYDTQGRMTEVGWVAGDWDQDQLQSLADEDPSWPETGASAYVRNTFDGTDDTPCMVGRLWRAEVDNSAENGGDLPLEGDEQSGLVVDTFAYDVSGNLLQHTREFEDFEAVSPISLTMAYSASGALLSTTDSLTEITHRKERNPAGRIVGVETVQDSASTTLATVEYTPAGKLQASTLLPASLAMLRSYDYASPEWPSSISDPILQETLTYTHGNADGGGYWTGAIASQSISVAGDEENQAFAVNGLGQMTAGQPGDGSSSAAMAWQLGPNGTFQTRTRDSVEEVFAYEPTPGSNRLVEISGDATSQRLSYCDNGAVRTITGDPDGDLSLTYGRTGGNLSTVQRTDSNGTTQITYHYGARGRAIRQVQGANPITALSLGHGGDATVILLSGENQEVIRLLSTPDTAVAISDGTTYLGLADHLGSIRAVIDDSGQVQGQYTYDLYGGTTVVQSPPIPWTTLFTGQTYDSDAGLYLFGMRPYHPGLSQFLMPDPRFEGPSPYSYTANNPILLTDPTGGSVQGMIAGIAVGATVTLAIGVAGVFTLGAGFAAAAAVGAVAGAVGSLAGDATTARVDGDRMTQKRIGIDLLAGAAGGVAGAMAGGAAGQLAARGALAAGFTARAITTTASLASGISGGIGGALASSGVSAGMTHQPLFSESLGVNIAVGAVAGAGAGVMAAGAHMGWTRLGGDVGVYPVELTEPGEINAQDPTGTHGSAGGLRGRVRILAPHDRLTGELESRWTRWVASGDSQAAVDWERSLTTVALGPDPAIATDTVALHGLPRYGLAEWQAPSGEYMNRPINSRTLAAYLRGEGYGAEGSGQPVKLVICFGATPGRLSLAQGLANELQVDVYAQRGVVNPFGDTSQGPWLRFQPR
ncbi:MAG: RHS repeat-associated core domain-containing protein [Acidobacteriota bacterium]